MPACSRALCWHSTIAAVSIRGYRSPATVASLTLGPVACVAAALGVKRLDADNTVPLSLVLAAFDIPDTVFARRALRMLDVDAVYEIDANAFLVGAWHVATLSRSDLCGYAFDLADLDERGTVGQAAVMQMILEVYGEGKNTSQLRSVIKAELQNLGGAGSGEIGRGAFVQLVTRHPGVLYPAIKMQRQLRRRLGGGKKRWERRERARRESEDTMMAPKAWRQLFQHLLSSDRRRGTTKHFAADRDYRQTMYDKRLEKLRRDVAGYSLKDARPAPPFSMSAAAVDVTTADALQRSRSSPAMRGPSSAVEEPSSAPSASDYVPGIMRGPQYSPMHPKSLPYRQLHHSRGDYGNGSGQNLSPAGAAPASPTKLRDSRRVTPAGDIAETKERPLASERPSAADRALPPVKPPKRSRTASPGLLRGGRVESFRVDRHAPTARAGVVVEL